VWSPALLAACTETSNQQQQVVAQELLGVSLVLGAFSQQVVWSKMCGAKGGSFRRHAAAAPAAGGESSELCYFP
jgi:hypothetical protein